MIYFVDFTPLCVQFIRLECRNGMQFAGIICALFSFMLSSNCLTARASYMVAVYEHTTTHNLFKLWFNFYSYCFRKRCSVKFFYGNSEKKGLKEFQEVITLYKKGRLKQLTVNYGQIV